MTVADRPGAYRPEWTTPPDAGPGWEIDGHLYPTNPRHLVTRGTWDYVALWQQCRSGMGGYAAWPDGGGVLNQAALTLEAFETLDAWLAARPKPKARR